MPLRFWAPTAALWERAAQSGGRVLVCAQADRAKCFVMVCQQPQNNKQTCSPFAPCSPVGSLGVTSLPSCVNFDFWSLINRCRDGTGNGWVQRSKVRTRVTRRPARLMVEPGYGSSSAYLPTVLLPAGSLAALQKISHTRCWFQSRSRSLQGSQSTNTCKERRSSHRNSHLKRFFSLSAVKGTFQN